MLNRIGLKNFKLHEDTSIEASRITVFIGPNNSGKSSVFQALLLVRQAALRHDQFLCQPAGVLGQQPPEPYQYPAQMNVDLGNFEEIIHRTREDLWLEFSGLVHSGRTADVSEATVSVQLQVRENKLVFHAGTIDISGQKGSWEFLPGGQSKTPAMRLDQSDQTTFSLNLVENFALTSPTGYRYNPAYPFPPANEKALLWNEFAQWLGSLPVSLLCSVHPVYPLRGFEEWGYPITDFAPSTLEQMTLHDRALALPNALAADRGLVQRLNTQLEKLLHIKIDFVTVPGKRLKILVVPSDNHGRQTLYLNEGTGANQVSFILVPLLLTPENETVVLSEPEAHLHPKHQTELTALLLTIAERQKLQLFIETHSEHVLHAILNSIARGDLKPSEVALYYFEQKDGAAHASKMEINEFGQVEGGLPGFFDQSLAELTDYLKALSKP